MYKNKYEELNHRIDKLYKYFEKYINEESTDNKELRKISKEFAEKYYKLAGKVKDLYNTCGAAITKLETQIKELGNVKPKKSFFGGKVKNQSEIDDAKSGVELRKELTKFLTGVFKTMISVETDLNAISNNGKEGYYTNETFLRYYNDLNNKLYDSPCLKDKLDAYENEFKDIKFDKDTNELYNKVLKNTKDIIKDIASVFKSDEYKHLCEYKKLRFDDSEKTHQKYAKSRDELSAWKTKVKNAIIDNDYSDPEVRQAIKDYGKSYFGVF